MDTLIPMLQPARQILGEADTPERRKADLRFWVEEPKQILREFLDSNGEKRARVVADEIGTLSNSARVRADRAIAFEGRRDLEAEAEELLFEF